MISVNASEETREQYICNIIATWRAATPGQIQRGRTWYRTAHGLASQIANGDARAGAGVLAALSANKSWSENCRLAHQAYETGIPSGHFQDALSKVARIMAGEDPVGVLPMERKTGPLHR